MKNATLLFWVFCFAALSMFTSCQKGKDLVSPGFGKLSVIATFSSDASPLLIQIDGKTADTLTAIRPAIDFPIQTGERHIVLVNRDSKQIFADTTVQIEVTKTFVLPPFLYTGTATLFDDLTAKPAADSMLVRLVTLDPKLPDILDIEISLYDFAGTRVPLANKKFTGVRKDRFSNFIQFPDPAILAPNTVAYYVIEGFDPATNNKKVLSIDDGSFSFIVDNNFSPFAVNTVLSLGIGAPADPDPIHLPIPIFTRIAE